MTDEELRDHFAAAALTGILAGQFADTVPHHEGGREAAFYSYMYADAMLQARAQTKAQNDEKLDADLMKYLVRRMGGYRVEIVRGNEKLIGWFKGRTIAMRDLRNAVLYPVEPEQE